MTRLAPALCFFVRIFPVAALVFLVACGSDTSGSGAATADATTTDDVATLADTTTTGVTFHKDVEPILQAKCQGCHSGTGIAPFALVSYDDAKTRVESLIASIESQKMPPWGARETDECKPRFGWQHDLRVTPTEKATLDAWLANGTPEGNAADAPKTNAAPTLALANVDLTVKPAKAHVTSGKDDQLRCFIIDPKLTEAKWLNGIQIIPGNPLVVHHALVFMDPTNESAKLGDADGEYDCFGGPGISGKLIEAWAPGAVPLEFPSNVGTPIPAGTKFVMQIHYHPAGKTADPDTTQIQVRFNKSAPEWTGASVLIGNFGSANENGGTLLPGDDDGPNGVEFVIPPNKAAHNETMRFAFPGQLNGKPLPELHVYGVGTHMHYVGRDMKVWVDRAFAAPACTSAQLDPLLACTQKNCPGATGGDLVTCATKSCATEAAALQGACGDCIKAGVIGGAAVADLKASCEKVQEKPATITDPASECFVQTPAWDFDWQRIYNYDAPIEQLPILRAGDSLGMRCTYDNTLNNPAVKLALELKGLTEPVAVKLGETTLDEMCLAIVQVVFKAP